MFDLADDETGEIAIRKDFHGALYNLKTVAQRIFYEVIAKVNTTKIGSRQLMKVSALEVCKAAKGHGLSKGYIYKQFVPSCREVAKLGVRFACEDNDAEYSGEVNIFKGYVIKKTKCGVLECYFSMSEASEKYFTRFGKETFTRMFINQLRKLTKPSAGRLYEWLRGIHWYDKKTLVSKAAITLPSLQKLLDWIEPDARDKNGKKLRPKTWNNFRDRILLVALKSVNDETDLSASYEITKRGAKGKTLELTFTITDKAEKHEVVEEISEESHQERIIRVGEFEIPAHLIEDIKVDVGLSESTLLKMKKYHPDVLRDSLTLFAHSSSAYRERDPAGYFLKTIARKQRKFNEEQATATSEKAVKRQPTIEELTDKSWFDKYEFDLE